MDHAVPQPDIDHVIVRMIMRRIARLQALRPDYDVARVVLIGHLFYSFPLDTGLFPDRTDDQTSAGRSPDRPAMPARVTLRAIEPPRRVDELGFVYARNLTSITIGVMTVAG